MRTHDFSMTYSTQIRAQSFSLAGSMCFIPRASHCRRCESTSYTWVIQRNMGREYCQWYQHVAFESMGIIFPNRKPLRLLEGICTGQTSKVYIHTQHLCKYEHTYTSMSKRHTEKRICSIQLHEVGNAMSMKGVLHTHKSYGCFQK